LNTTENPAEPLPEASPQQLSALYYDGQSAVARPVQLHIANARLHISGDGVALEQAVSQLAWPEDQRHGPRLLLLPGGGQIQCLDGAAWDAWAAAHGQRGSLAVRLQQSWRGTLVALVAVLLAGWWFYSSGLPLLSVGVLALTPTSIDQSIGVATLQQLDDNWLAPSQLPLPRQQQLQERLAAALQRQARSSGVASPEWHLQFRRSRGRQPGSNAFALPGGDIVLTDELAELLHDRDDALLGVLAHEVGHLRHRHGMRLLVQSSLLGVATGLLLNDFGSMLSAAPLLLGQLAYSRDFERQADDEAIAVLQASGIRPDDMVVLFERLHERSQANDPESNRQPDWQIGFATHPADQERIERLRAASR
jgi:Zn-dependent protease with chaperone function